MLLKFQRQTAANLGNIVLKKKLIENKEFRETLFNKRKLIAKERWTDGKCKKFKCDWNGRKHKEETKKKIGISNQISQLGEKNSHFGTVWIYNLELKISKSIKKEELEVYINQGWIKGRKMKF